MVNEITCAWSMISISRCKEACMQRKTKWGKHTYRSLSHAFREPTCAKMDLRLVTCLK